jgi:pimeloyl-ACP methyl ester carboxylesterase
LYLGDGAWEELFDALRLLTLLLVPPDSPVAPRQKAVHNDLVRTVVVPSAGHYVRRDQPARYLRTVDAFLAEVARASKPGARRMTLIR